MGSITRFIKQDEGADLIEYALLAGLISLAAVATLTSVGGSIKDLFDPRQEPARQRDDSDDVDNDRRPATAASGRRGWSSPPCF